MLSGLLVGGEPVGAGAEGDLEGDGEGEDIFHCCLNKGFDLVELFVGNVEEEFVVDLQNHLGAKGAGAEFAVDGDHGKFDDVGGGALDGHIDGDALGGIAGGTVAGVDVGEGATTSKEGLGITVFARGLDGGVHKGFDGGVLCEVGINEVLRFFAWDAEARGESEGGDAVDDAEVDHLAVGALAGGDLFLGDVVNDTGGLGVDVLAILEGLNHAFVAAHGCHDAELDLGVVGGEEGPTGFASDEGGADALATVGANGDVLEVGVGGGESPGVGEGLVEGGMNAPVGGVDMGREFVDVGILQLHAGAPIEQEVNDGMAVAQLEEEFFVGRELTASRALDGRVEVEVAEEEFADLFGGSEVDTGTGEVADGEFEAEDFAFNLGAEVAKGGRFKLYANVFHP